MKYEAYQIYLDIYVSNLRQHAFEIYHLFYWDIDLDIYLSQMEVVYLGYSIGSRITGPNNYNRILFRGANEDNSKTIFLISR